MAGTKIQCQMKIIDTAYVPWMLHRNIFQSLKQYYILPMNPVVCNESIQNMGGLHSKFKRVVASEEGEK